MKKKEKKKVKTAELYMKIVEIHKIITFFIMYKMFKVTAKTFAKNCVHTITVNKTDNRLVLWIKMIDIQKKLDVKNIHDLVSL